MVALARAAGLASVEARPKGDYVSVFDGASDPLYQRIRAALPAGRGPGDYVTSVEVLARRPA
jgi:hypothetical protein